MKGENGMTEAQKKQLRYRKKSKRLASGMDLILLSLKNGIGFVDPKENKIVMVWRPQYKPETPSLHPMEENTSADFKPATQKPSGGNMSAFIFGGSKGSGRFMGNKRKHTVRGMKRR